MHMDMEDGLPSSGLICLEEGESIGGQGVPKQPCHPGNGLHEATRSLGCHVEERARMDLGHYERVPTCEGSDVEKGECRLVLVDAIRRCSSIDDGAEDAGVFGGHEKSVGQALASVPR